MFGRRSRHDAADSGQSSLEERCVIALETIAARLEGRTADRRVMLTPEQVAALFEVGVADDLLSRTRDDFGVMVRNISEGVATEDDIRMASEFVFSTTFMRGMKLAGKENGDDG